MPGSEEDRSKLAESIGEAGGEIVKEPDLTTLLAQMETARANVEQARVVKEGMIIRKIEDRGRLLGEIKDSFGALKAAREILKFYESLEANGELDQEAQKAYSEAKATVDLMDKQIRAAGKRTGVITQEPEIKERLRKGHQEARKEGDYEAKFEKAQQELFAKVEGLVKRIKELAEQLYFIKDDINRHFFDLNKTQNDLSNLMLKAKEGKDLNINPQLAEIIREIGHYTGDDLRSKLQTLRDELGGKIGLGDRKEKKVIDEILAQKNEFASYDQAMARARELRVSKGVIESQATELKDEFSTLMLEAWSKSDQLSTEGYVDSNKRVYRPDQLASLTYYHLRDLAKADSKDQKRNEAINFIYKEVEKGGERYIYTHPKHSGADSGN